MTSMPEGKDSVVGMSEPPFGSQRAAALALYKAPFSFRHGYIHDADGRMVADQDGFEGAVETHIAARVRGWGRIGYMPNPESLQDEVGVVIAEALTAFWNAADLAAAGAKPETQEPFWHAVVSERAPVINKAIRRADVAEEYADKCREQGYPDIEVVALYRASPSSGAAEGAKPAVPDEVMQALEQALEFAADHEDIRDGDDGPLPNRAMNLAAELRVVISKIQGGSHV